jgi:hypothetical protein
VVGWVLVLGPALSFLLSLILKRFRGNREPAPLRLKTL